MHAVRVVQDLQVSLIDKETQPVILMASMKEVR